MWVQIIDARPKNLIKEPRFGECEEPAYTPAYLGVDVFAFLTQVHEVREVVCGVCTLHPGRPSPFSIWVTGRESFDH